MKENGYPSFSYYSRYPKQSKKAVCTWRALFSSFFFPSVRCSDSKHIVWHAVSFLRISPTLEHRLPLLLERPESLVPVLSSHHPLIHVVLLVLSRPRHSLQGRADSHGAALTNLLRQTNSFRQSRLPRHLEKVGFALASPLGYHLDQTVSQAEEVGLRGSDTTAREDQVSRAGEANDGGQAGGASRAGDDAQAGLGQANGRVGGQDTEMRREGEFEAAAESEGGDGRYGGDLEL